MTVARPLVDRFWEKVEKTPGCWNWTGAKSTAGYGSITGYRLEDGRYKRLSAHRLSYTIHKGDIQVGLQIDHLCRNRGCVNPDHLEAVTAAVNSRRSAQAKLSIEKAREIRDALTERVHAFAKEFGVSPWTIAHAVVSNTWAEEEAT